MKFMWGNIAIHILGPELQCLLKVKQDLSEALIFQHVILNAKYIVLIDVVFVVKYTIVIFRKNETILILIKSICYFSHPKNQY